MPVSRPVRWLGAGIVLAAVAVALLVAATDGRLLLEAARSVDPRRLVLPLLCTAGSYAAMAVSYQRIAAAAGVDVPFGAMLRVTIASTAANYLFSTGGMSGLAVRGYYFSRHRGLSSGAAVSISLAQTFITNLTLFAFLFWGLLDLVFYDDVGGRSLLVVFAFFLLSLALVLAAVVVVAFRAIRLRLFRLLMRIPDLAVRALAARREALRARLARFEHELHEGVDFLIAKRSRMVAPLAWICADWFLMLATLYTAFHSLDQQVPMHTVVIGFSIGVLLSIVNLVPAGLGIAEGSMAAVFVSLGVPLEPALVATVIFRLCYYALPLCVTLLFLRRTFLPPAHATRARPPRPGDASAA
jgi:uncharacterized protein (TIRG00374 family)